MGPIGMQEMIGLFVIALLLFGPKKLPELGRTLGKAMSEFRRAKNELTKTFETHMNELEKETRIEPVKEFTPSTYSYPYDDYGRYEEPVASSEPHLVEQTQQPEQTHQLEQTHETGSSTTASTTSTSVHEPTPAAHEAAAVPRPVAGTIPRANGIEPIARADQEHPS